MRSREMMRNQQRGSCQCKVLDGRRLLLLLTINESLCVAMHCAGCKSSWYAALPGALGNITSTREPCDLLEAAVDGSVCGRPP